MRGADAGRHPPLFVSVTRVPHVCTARRPRSLRAGSRAVALPSRAAVPSRRTRGLRSRAAVPVRGGTVLCGGSRVCPARGLRSRTAVPVRDGAVLCGGSRACRARVCAAPCDGCRARRGGTPRRATVPRAETQRRNSALPTSLSPAVQCRVAHDSCVVSSGATRATRRTHACRKLCRLRRSRSSRDPFRYRSRKRGGCHGIRPSRVSESATQRSPSTTAFSVAEGRMIFSTRAVSGR